MPRYTDANAFQEKLAEVEREPDYMHEGEDWRCGISLAGTLLDGFPTADVVEVVRCKDCERSRPMTFDGFYYCKRYRVCKRADDFCSGAKRKGV